MLLSLNKKQTNIKQYNAKSKWKHLGTTWSFLPVLGGLRGFSVDENHFVAAAAAATATAIAAQ